MPPKRYFDNDESGGGNDRSPAKYQRDSSDRGGGRGRGRGAAARGRGGRGASSGTPRQYDDSRPKKEPFKPKQGFISAGLKAFADTNAASTSSTEPASADAKKEEIAEGWKDKTTTQTTLHLTRLPPTLTSPQLTLIFSSYAPLRSAFVVSVSSGPKASKTDASSANAIAVGPGRDRTGKATSRGFGYVRFVLKADADKCLEEWGGPSGLPRSACRELEGTEGLENVDWAALCDKDGMKMQWAKKKLKEGEEPQGKTPSSKARKEKKARVAPVEGEDGTAAPEEIEEDATQHRKWRPGVFDYNAPRTVIVQGLPVPLTEAELAAKAESGAMDVDEDHKRSESDGEPTAEVDDEKENDAEAGEGDASNGKAVDWKKALKQKAKKTGDVEDVKWPFVLPSGETVAIIVMYTPRHAHEVMKKLHNHVFRGIVVSAAVKSTWDLCQRLGRGKGGGRLVVRNLGFDVTIADLRTVFARFGSLHSITLPQDSTTSKPRGFAFIYYVTKSDAEKALKAVNGTRIYAGMAAERVENEGGKGGKKKEVREKKKAAEKASLGGGGDKGRLVAVDWALSKDDWKKAQEAEKGDAASASGSESGSDDDSSDDDEDEDSDEESDSDASDMSPEPMEVEAHPDDDDDELEEEPKGPEPEKGMTLFVRNMSFEATEAELYDLFKAFGPIRYARIVYDPTTKRSRGTAFVHFWNEEDAHKVLHESESLNAGLYVGETSDKKQRAQPQSLLMADPGTTKASKLTLHGRVLAAVAAVSKDDADKLREDRDKKGAAKTDRRNLYLMREGVIFPSWAIAQTLHPSDMNARQGSFDARKALLRSNPSLYISRTRLSIRQVPLYVSDGMLKRLANYALKEFERDVKAGNQKALTADELRDYVADASGAAPPPSKAERFKGVPPSRVRQSKILRQNDRVDPLTGLGRSKGYGFLELGSHADALRVLRWANANKEVNALFRTWWREALEKMIEKVERGEGAVGKGVQVKEKEERLKRLREKMSELEEEEQLAAGKAAKREAKGTTTGEGGRSSKCLIIEFSIENAVTTKRRAEKAERARERAKRTKRDDLDEDAEASDEEDAKPKGKKRKADAETAPNKKSKKSGKEAKDESTAEPGAEEGEKKGAVSIGSIIGRKRKQKKGK